MPYAAAPIGELAFARPQPHPGWAGIRDATGPGATAQVRGFDDSTIPEPSYPGDEVLAVDVFTPTDALSSATARARLPVFVWIHGGGFVAGSPHSPWYDGVAFNREGIVVVSVGYRLGVVGFGDVAGAEANRAVHDWVSALHWVRDNIASFGGDPTRVTIGGQSAGAAAVLTLMGVDVASPLFHGVVAASPVLLQATHRTARRTTREVAGILGVEPTASALAAVPRDQLADVPQRLRNAFGNASGEADAVELIRTILDSVQFPPLIDGELLRLPVREALRRGRSQRTPLLIGATAHEFNSLLAGVGRVPDSADEALRRLGFTAHTAERYVHARSVLPASDLFAQLLSDLMVRDSVAAVAECHEPTWVYDFAWRPTEGIGAGEAFHCLDLPFAWGVSDAVGARRATGATPAGLMESVHGGWVSFIKRGDPGWAPYARGRTVRVYDTVTVDIPDGYAIERLLRDEADEISQPR